MTSHVQLKLQESWPCMHASCQRAANSSASLPYEAFTGIWQHARNAHIEEATCRKHGTSCSLSSASGSGPGARGLLSLPHVPKQYCESACAPMFAPLPRAAEDQCWVLSSKVSKASSANKLRRVLSRSAHLPSVEGLGTLKRTRGNRAIKASIMPSSQSFELCNHTVQSLQVPLDEWLAM